MACKIRLKGQNPKEGSHIELFEKESSDHGIDKGEEVIEKVEEKQTPQKECEEEEHTKDRHTKKDKFQSDKNVIENLEYGWAESARNTIKKGRNDHNSNDADIEELAEELAVLLDQEITRKNGIESKRQFVAVSCRETDGRKKGRIYKS